MSFFLSDPAPLPPAHTAPVTELCHSAKFGLVASLAPGECALWTLDRTPSLLRTLHPPAGQTFARVAFTDESAALLTSTNRVVLFSLETFDLLPAFVEIPAEERVVFFKLVGKYLYALTASGTIFYISRNLARMRTRSLDLALPIARASNSSGSLFLLLEDGRLVRIQQNDVDTLGLPTVARFDVDSVGREILIQVPRGEWQLWSVDSPAHIGSVAVSARDAVISPVSSTAVCLSASRIDLLFNTTRVQSVDFDNPEQCIFDSLGRILFVSSGASLFFAELATLSAPFNPTPSLPVSRSAVFAPERIQLPDDSTPLFAARGNDSLAVVTSKGIFVRDSEWRFIPAPHTRSVGWSGQTLVALVCSDEARVVGYVQTEQKFAVKVRSKASAIAVCGGKVLVSYPSSISIVDIETDEKTQTINFGDSGVRQAAWLNPETQIVHLEGRRVLFIYKAKVTKTFEDISAFQLTGSNAWPLLLFGETWWLVGANGSQLELNESIPRCVFEGVDGFSLRSWYPPGSVDFAHLVVRQSLAVDSFASAVSILSQVSDQRKIDILTKVGGLGRFGRFLKLVERFPGIEDEVLSTVDLGEADPGELFKHAFGKRWYRTAASLVANATVEEAVDLMCNSEFDPYVVERVSSAFPQLFDSFASAPASDALRWKVDGELNSYFRLCFMKQTLEKVADLVPYLKTDICNFLFRTHRERAQAPEDMNGLLEVFRRCSYRQTAALSGIFAETNEWELLFLSAFVQRDFAVCLRCIEQAPYIASKSPPALLSAIGLAG